MKFTRAGSWINSKISNRDAKTQHSWYLILPLLLVIIMIELLKVFDCVELLFLKSLKVQIKLALQLCNPFLIKNYNMNGNSVGKECSPVLNVKLKVKLRFKAFNFESCYILLSPTLWTRLALLEIFAYPSIKRIIYKPELNLWNRVLWRDVINFTAFKFLKVFHKFCDSNINPFRPDPGQTEKINLKFCSHTSLWLLSYLFSPQRNVKIKI